MAAWEVLAKPPWLWRVVTRDQRADKVQPLVDELSPDVA
jgi:hypothetical protein